ncbi:MAG: transposase [bacterium]|nr:transposase [bacterium]
MLNVGIDYHKKFSYGTIMNEKGEIIKQGVLQNSFAGVSKFINGCKCGEEIEAVMEATRNWDFPKDPVEMYDWLDEVVDEVKLVHPLKVKVIAEADKKTDKIDSTVLANLLRTGFFTSRICTGQIYS